MSRDRDPLVICVDDISTDAQVLLREHRRLVELERFAEPDSFPTQSGGGRGAPTNEVDDDGTPVPQHSDPTFRAVEAREDGWANPVRAARRKVESTLYEARRLLDRALSDARQLAAPPRLDPEVNAKHDRAWCTHHAAMGFPTEPVRTDAPETGLCRWCADWRRDAEIRQQSALVDGTPNPLHDPAWPLMPPKAVLRRRSEGAKITTKVLRECGLAA